MTQLDPLLVARWRSRAADGTITKDELREAYAALRAARGTIPVAVAGSKVNKAKAAGKAVISSDDLLAGLGPIPD